MKNFNLEKVLISNDPRLPLFPAIEIYLSTFKKNCNSSGLEKSFGFITGNSNKTANKKGLRLHQNLENVKFY